MRQLSRCLQQSRGNQRTAKQSDLGHVPYAGRPADKGIRAVGARAALGVDEEVAPEAGLGVEVGGGVVPQEGSALAVHVVEAGVVVVGAVDAVDAVGAVGAVGVWRVGEPAGFDAAKVVAHLDINWRVCQGSAGQAAIHGCPDATRRECLGLDGRRPLMAMEWQRGMCILIPARGPATKEVVAALNGSDCSMALRDGDRKRRDKQTSKSQEVPASPSPGTTDRGRGAKEEQPGWYLHIFDGGDRLRQGRTGSRRATEKADGLAVSCCLSCV